jgi:serine/threonine protein kinase
VQPGSDRWVQVTESRFKRERDGLDAVRAMFPDADPYRVWSNLEIITDRGRSLEIDLLVVGPGGLYVVELKAWSGRITGDRYVWQLRGDRVITQENPYRLVNDKAKALKGLLDQAVRSFIREKCLKQHDVKLPWVQAAVLLHSATVRFELAPEDRTSVYGLIGNATLPSIRTLITAVPRNKDDAMTAARTKALGLMLDRIGMTRRRVRRVGPYRLDAKIFTEGPGYQDFLANHERYPDERVRVRLYGTGSATTTEERTTLDRAAEREYRLLRHLAHPGLIAPSQHSKTDMGPALVYPYDESDVRLDHLISTQGDRLDLETRLALVRGLAETLRYAHGRRITHRGLSPRSVWVRLRPGQTPLVRVADWQTGAATGSSAGMRPGTVIAGTRHVDTLLGAATYAYQAPEAGRSGSDEVRLDVFALGATAYLAITGRPPAADPVMLRQRVADEGGLDLAAHLDAAPEALRSLVLDATRGDVSGRLPDVDTLLDRLAAVETEVRPPEPAADTDPLEASPGALLAGRFRLERRLGGGSTAVGLLVTDTTDGVLRVLKVPGTRTALPGCGMRRRCSAVSTMPGWPGSSRSRSRSGAARRCCWTRPATPRSPSCFGRPDGSPSTGWSASAPTCSASSPTSTASVSRTATSSRTTSASTRSGGAGRNTCGSSTSRCPGHRRVT